MPGSKSVYRLLWLLLLALAPAEVVATASPQSVPAAGPLRRLPANPRYFSDGSGRAVYLSGSHTWANFQSSWLYAPVTPTQYLNVLQQNNHNFMRLWVADTAWSPYTNAFIEPQPYLRSGPGNAADGGLKFDLSRLNQAYFDSLRSLVDAARTRGIYVSVMLFDSWGISGYRSAPHNITWNYHPFRALNNINGINGDPNNDGIGTEFHSLQIPAIKTLQETYVRKVIDTVNDLDNVLYEICNESGSYSTSWQYSMINYIKSYEAAKPKQHPVGMTFGYSDLGSGTNADLFNSPADWISPGAADGYWDNPPASNGSKVIITDTDHVNSTSSDATWIWRSFLRGLNPIVMDWWNGTQWDPIRRAMGTSRTYADKMSLAAMLPRNDLASTTYCLANVGAEYLAYQPGNGAFTVNLSAATYSVEWLNLASGAVTNGGSVTSGNGNLTFTPPFAGSAVLYLKATSAPPPTPGELIGYWTLDESSGTVAADSSGKGNAGVLMNGAAWTNSGRLAGAVSLDGVDDHIKVNPSTSLNSITNQLTLAAWVYRNVNQAGDHLVISRQYGTSFGDQYFLGFHDNAYMVGVQTTAGYAVPIVGAAPTAQWIHLAGTYDGATVRLYVNGSQVSSLSGNGNILLDSARPLIIGAGQNDATSAVQEAFNGRADDVRVYSKALSPAEIQSLASGDPPPPPPGGMNEATFVSQSVPTSMVAGQTYSVSVTMKNSGTSTWTAGSGYKLGSQNPQDNVTWGTSRVTLASGDSIAPGQSKTFTWNVPAPAAAGTYNFQWRMVQETVEWFGGGTLNLAVGVAAAPPLPPLVGTVYREYWSGIPGNAVTDLTLSLNYRSSPSGFSWETSFEAPTDSADAYGARMRAYLVAPVTGTYTFWIASDDNGELWLGSDANPATKGLIASVPGWTLPREWTKYPSQISAPILLVAGQRYYLEALQKEGLGGDNLAVRWQLPDGTIEEPLPGTRLSAIDPLDSDGDGYSDAAELAAGTNPYDSASNSGTLPGAGGGGGGGGACGATGMECLLLLTLLSLIRKARRRMGTCGEQDQ